MKELCRAANIAYGGILEDVEAEVFRFEGQPVSVSYRDASEISFVFTGGRLTIRLKTDGETIHADNGPLHSLDMGPAGRSDVINLQDDPSIRPLIGQACEEVAILQDLKSTVLIGMQLRIGGRAVFVVNLGDKMSVSFDSVPGFGPSEFSQIPCQSSRT